MRSAWRTVEKRWEIRIVVRPWVRSIDRSKMRSSWENSRPRCCPASPTGLRQVAHDACSGKGCRLGNGWDGGGNQLVG
jgi:hypothetical protein